MNSFKQGVVIIFAITINLMATGRLLILSWFEPSVSSALAAFLLFWFLLNVALAFVAFSRGAKD